MRHYVFKIRPQFLDLIRNGTKKHEYRLNKPDRKLIKNGDRILLLSNVNQNDCLMVQVVSKKEYLTWEDSLRDNWKEDFSGKYPSFNDVLNICYKFYSFNDVKKYGIVKIGIEPIPEAFKQVRVLLDTNIIIQRESYNNVSYEVANVYKWLEKLNCTKLIHPNTINELKKYKDPSINKMLIKLESYEKIIPSNEPDDYFNSIIRKFPINDNSNIDNDILLQVYDGVVDLLITEDRAMLKKAEMLGIRSFVLSCAEYLKKVEEYFPKLISYKMLLVKKEKFGNINLDDKFFDTLKEDYPNFETWFKKKNNEEAYVFKNKENKVSGFLYLKIEDRDETDYFKVNPFLRNNKKLKIGTFKIDNDIKGFRLGERFLKIIFDNALKNNVDEIYVTLFQNHRKEISYLENLLNDWGFCYYGSKESANGKMESVFVKEMKKYDVNKTIKFNFPNISPQRKIYMLPINPEYHTDLFPDAILKNEDMNLYSENKAHSYSLEKIYISGTYKNEPQPGDFLLIYRRGERYPKRYSSVCTSIAILEEIIKPTSLEEYLNICKNKSVFSREQLIEFYMNNKYRTIIKLILYKTLENKITLDSLIKWGYIDSNSGPRTFDELPEKYFKQIEEENHL